MYGVKVRIRRITELSPPDVFVEALFTDYGGQVHYFRDKLPVFSSEWEPQIPCDGVIRCRVTEEAEKWVVIDTMLPDDVESTMGEYQFKIARSDLVDNA